MSIVVTGSLAYDHIMLFKDEFGKHILPDKTHMINVAFTVDDLSKQYGGTAGNIAYSLHLLGMKPRIVATVGDDFTEYFDRIKEWGLSLDGIKEIEGYKTAQAFITTDLKDNQITAFYGGALFRAQEQPLSVIDEKPESVILSPNAPQAMYEHAQYCRDKSWDFWFDPGQAMSAMKDYQLKECLESSQGLIVNDYEWEMYRDKTGYNVATVLEKAPYVLVTKGEKGVQILTRDGVDRVAAVSGVKLVDPTGAGDAFRSGLLYGLHKGLGIMESCKYACAVASFAVECEGTQNHVFSLSDVEERRNSL